MEQSQRNLAAGLTRTRAGLIGSLVGGLILAGGSALAEHQGEEVDFRVHRSPFSIDVMGRWGQPLFTLTDGVEVSTVNGSKPREQSFLLRWSQGETVRRVVVDQVLAVSEAGPSTTIILGEAGSTEPRARLILSRPAEGVLRILAVAIDPTTNRMRILLTARPEERFYGMGSRFDNSEHKNSTVTQWAREVATNLPGIARSGRAEGRDTTYYPVPFYLSSKGYGLLLDDSRYSEFDFQNGRSDRISILNFNRSTALNIYTGSNPLEIISRQTTQTGRLYRVPPPWAFGTWADSIKSSKEARSIAKTIRQNRIPVSVIMIEDWWWSDLMMGNLWGILNFTPQVS